MLLKNGQNTFMTKSVKREKREKSEDLSRNHEQRIKFRKRLQDDREREKEMKEWEKHAGTEIQDEFRGNNLQD